MSPIMKDIRCFVFSQVVKWYKHCFLVLFHYSIPLSWDTNNRCEKLQKEISDVYMRPLPPPLLPSSMYPSKKCSWLFGLLRFWIWKISFIYNFHKQKKFLNHLLDSTLRKTGQKSSYNVYLSSPCWRNLHVRAE